MLGAPVESGHLEPALPSHIHPNPPSLQDHGPRPSMEPSMYGHSALRGKSKALPALWMPSPQGSPTSLRPRPNQCVTPTCTYAQLDLGPLPEPLLSGVSGAQRSRIQAGALLDGGALIAHHLIDAKQGSRSGPLNPSPIPGWQGAPPPSLLTSQLGTLRTHVPAGLS